MSESSVESQTWSTVRSYLLGKELGFSQSEPGDTLTLQLDDEDWQLEVTPGGLLVCQAGYALEDMQSLLSDGTPEDLGSDELAKQTKFYLNQIVSKHRNWLKHDGFVERTEMNDEYVAVFYERTMDLKNLSELEHAVRRCRKQFTPSP